VNVKKKKRHHQKVLGGRGTWKSAAPRGKTCACGALGGNRSRKVKKRRGDRGEGYQAREGA